MQSQSLLFGVVGFILGGLLVAIAATTFDKSRTNSDDEMSMSAMTADLKDKRGDDYDKAFVAYMIDHHQAAVDMARLSETRAKHREVRQLSKVIITAQEKEIREMKHWQKNWGYPSSPMMNNAH